MPSKANYNEILSPDGKKAAYIKGHNLWVRNTETGEHTQLTTDGEKHYGYATNNAGWIRSDRPVLLWGPNSEKIATFQHDSRDVKEMYLYNSKVGHSDLERWKYPMPGDSTVFKIERVIVHLGDKPKVVRLDMEPDLKRYIDDEQRQVMRFIKPIVQPVPFAKAWQNLTNFNTPKDFARACLALNNL